MKKIKKQFNSSLYFLNTYEVDGALLSTWKGKGAKGYNPTFTTFTPDTKEICLSFSVTRKSMADSLRKARNA
jgi:hypothetical protein